MKVKYVVRDANTGEVTHLIGIDNSRKEFTEWLTGDAEVMADEDEVSGEEEGAGGEV